MTTPQEKFAADMQTQVTAQQQQWAAFANNAMEGTIRLFELNCQVAKGAFDESAAISQRLLSAKTPQEWLSLNSDILHKNIQRSITYANQVSDISSRLQAELNQAAKANFEDSCKLAGGLGAASTDDSSSAMATTPIEFVKSAMENISGGYARWVDANQKIVDTMTKNFKGDNMATKSASKNGGKAASRSHSA
jgi:phasin family protein